MEAYKFNFGAISLTALSTGALWWADKSLLCVSDLHLGKSERVARREGRSLPPYETADTLAKLEGDLHQTQAKTVVCLGDSFDDLGAAMALSEEHRQWITQLQTGRDWIWIKGNHDPAPNGLGGRSMYELSLKPLVFRHIAQARASGEISGHYHPKAHVHVVERHITRPAFLFDAHRVILPAYGTYTGGLDWEAPALRSLLQPVAFAILTGKTPVVIPVPR